MYDSGETVGLAEGIIDETSHVVHTFELAMDSKVTASRITFFTHVRPHNLNIKWKKIKSAGCVNHWSLVIKLFSRQVCNFWYELDLS